MALIPAVGRRSLKTRVLLGALYLALTLGAVTMVYPFLVMFGTSLESQYDVNSDSLIPRYLYNAPALFGKYAEDKYKADIGAINSAYGTDYATLTDIRPPAHIDAARVADWNTFVAGLPMRYKLAGFGGASAAYSPSPLLDRYHDFLVAEFRGDARALDTAYTEEDASVLTVFPPFEQPSMRSWTPDGSRKSLDWAAFKRTLPPSFFQVIGADPLHQQWLKEVAYADIGALNTAWGTHYPSFTAITLPARTAGLAPAAARDWQTFVRTRLPFRDVVVSSAALPQYQSYLQRLYANRLAAYNTAYHAHLTAWSQLTLPDPDALPSDGPPLLNWLGFLTTAAPSTALSVDTPETRWRAWAQNRYHLDATHASVLPMPIREADWAYVLAHKAPLRWDFVARNYRLVTQYILLHGDGVWVTIVYCTLAVLTALFVNPLCAYALSRYNLSYGNAVLLFLLTTMAFPAEVTMIPGFLLLKQLHFLNTFWALILPGAASGFNIFLMKGFFDSLPRELYEAGVLDGAGEMRMFTSITLPLSRPIFAVIGLGAFTSAYGAFMFALLTCQNPHMWTLMVWLYEMSANSAPQYVMMAALTLAAIPTLLVFIFAQNTIMKGIILPSYK